MTKDGIDKLKDAYSEKTPQENAAFYRDFAATYDAGFAADTGYVYPREVARVFLEHAGPDDTPVLDIGAGTGLLAEQMGGLQIDGIDISAEMLEMAAVKGLYRNRIVADLTGKLEIPDASYGAMVSSGTFTHGHLGPAVLEELLRIAKPGALFCLGVNPQIYDSAGFGSAFAWLVAERRTTPLEFSPVDFFENVEHEHAKDRGFVARFRKR